MAVDARPEGGREIERIEACVVGRRSGGGRSRLRLPKVKVDLGVNGSFAPLRLQAQIDSGRRGLLSTTAPERPSKRAHLILRNTNAPVNTTRSKRIMPAGRGTLDGGGCLRY